jgi:hypothetical protein
MYCKLFRGSGTPKRTYKDAGFTSYIKKSNISNTEDACKGGQVILFEHENKGKGDMANLHVRCGTTVSIEKGTLFDKDSGRAPSSMYVPEGVTARVTFTTVSGGGSKTYIGGTGGTDVPRFVDDSGKDRNDQVSEVKVYATDKKKEKYRNVPEDISNHMPMVHAPA